MFCIRNNVNEFIPSIATDVSFLEMIAVDCLPYCKACLEFRKSELEYAAMLNNQEIHPIVRFVYVLINGIYAITEYREKKILEYIEKKQDDPESVTEKYTLSFSQEMVNRCFDIYHSFYDEIEKYYPIVFGEAFNHETIHEEIRKYGMSEMITEGRFGLKHMLHHIHLMLFHSEYDKALDTACRMYLRFSKADRKSFSRSKHEMFGEHVLLIGSSLDEGDAEQGAINDMKDFLSGIGVDFGIDTNKYDSHQYVIERRMFNMITKKFGVTAEEIRKGLFPLSSAFNDNPCLYPRLLISSDEVNLVEFKEVLNQLS